MARVTESHAAAAVEPHGLIHGGLRLTVLGIIAAGSGIEAVEDRDPESWVDVVPRGAPFFTLRVTGDSMVGDHIYHDDLVLVTPTDEAKDGEIVVALLTSGPSEAGEITIKRYYREPPSHVRLQPSNPEMAPIIVLVQDVRLQGRVRAVVRPLS